MNRKSIFVLLSGVLFLAVLGIVMLMSTCVFSAHADESNVYREAKKQVVWLVLGGAACWVTAMIDYRFWKRGVWFFLIVTGFLLALCFVPGVGMLINGERRWIGVGPFQVQPSELAKLTVVFFLAFWYSRYPDSGKNLFRGFLAPLSLVGAIVLLVLFEVDIGSTAVLSLTVLLILFVAGVDWKYLAGLVLLGVGGFIGMMSYSPDRIERLAAFIDPEEHRLGAGFQQWISLMALGSGGSTGRGLGEGLLKMLYMPFAHTDFIFPMIGEELGLVGTLLVVFAFMCVVCSGMAIAFQAADRFGMIVAVGICGFLSIQAFFNIGVTTSILPNTGLPLPFVSYGGSSLVISFAAIGILINIFRQGRPAAALDPSDWSLQGDREMPRI